MKNVELKIKNETEDRRLGSEDRPMFTGGLARLSEGGDNVQGPKSKVQSHESEDTGGAKFEDLRLKTSFCAEGHTEGWTPNGEESRTRTRTKRRTLPAQSLTMWAILNHGRDRARCDLGQRWSAPRPGEQTSKDCVSGCVALRSLRPVGEWFSTYFHLLPLVSAVLIIKIFFRSPAPAGRGSGQQGGGTRRNSLKLAKTLVLKFFLNMKRNKKWLGLKSGSLTGIWIRPPLTALVISALHQRDLQLDFPSALSRIGHT
jgi:hypothetical protein